MVEVPCAQNLNRLLENKVSSVARKLATFAKYYCGQAGRRGLAMNGAPLGVDGNCRLVLPVSESGRGGCGMEARGMP